MKDYFDNGNIGSFRKADSLARRTVPARKVRSEAIHSPDGIRQADVLTAEGSRIFKGKKMLASGFDHSATPVATSDGVKILKVRHRNHQTNEGMLDKADEAVPKKKNRHIAFRSGSYNTRSGGKVHIDEFVPGTTAAEALRRAANNTDEIAKIDRAATNVRRGSREYIQDRGGTFNSPHNENINLARTVNKKNQRSSTYRGKQTDSNSHITNLSGPNSEKKSVNNLNAIRDTADDIIARLHPGGDSRKISNSAKRGSMTEMAAFERKLKKSGVDIDDIDLADIGTMSRQARKQRGAKR